MKYDRTVVAYHGCDADVAEELLGGRASFKKSQNAYDWLGEGIYFWEYGADRALKFAHDQKRRGKVKTPAIVGAIIQLGNCFDLMDTKFTGAASLRDHRPSAAAGYVIKATFSLPYARPLASSGSSGHNLGSEQGEGPT